MYRVIIAMDRVADAKTLAEACQIFIKKIKEEIEKGGLSQQILYEACMIEAEFKCCRGMMNFFAVKEFAHAVGILQEDGHLSPKPLPYIHPKIAEEVFIANNNASMEAWLLEHADILERIREAESQVQIPETPPSGTIITP